MATARSIWNGAISFGAVREPVKVYSAVEPKSVRFLELRGPHCGEIRVRRLTRTPGDAHRLGDDAEAAWSPDGRSIALISNRTGSPEVWLMNADGTSQRRLTATPRLDESGPVWTPDGRWILFDARAATRARAPTCGGFARSRSGVARGHEEA